MDEKRSKMLGVMITPSIEEVLRKEAARKKTTMSSLAFEILKDRLDQPTQTNTKLRSVQAL